MVNGELGTRNWLCALRPRRLTAALPQFTIQNLLFTIQKLAEHLAPVFQGLRADTRELATDNGRRTTDF